MGAQPVSNKEPPRSMQAGQGRGNTAAGSGPSGVERTMQGVGPPPRATAGMDYNQTELDHVGCSIFWALSIP
eukprot:9084685-Karenia_brevis.AAC.1